MIGVKFSMECNEFQTWKHKLSRESLDWFRIEKSSSVGYIHTIIFQIELIDTSATIGQKIVLFIYLSD